MKGCGGCSTTSQSSTFFEDRSRMSDPAGSDPLQTFSFTAYTVDDYNQADLIELSILAEE
jgi:hypothetical protein